MSDNSERIRDFVLKLLSKKDSGLNVVYRNVVNAYTDEELKTEYSKMKTVVERNNKVVSSFIIAVFLAFSGGLFKIFVDFSNKVTSVYGDSEKTLVLMNGLLYLLITLFVIVFVLFIFYLRKIDNNKTKFNYVEILMKERGLLG